MDRRNFLAGALALLAAAPKAAVAQGRWILLGSRMVSGTFSRDSIPVFRSRNPITALSFRTRGGEVQISDIEVIFTRGRSERLMTRVTARPNLQSRTITLRTRDREIRRVEFTYRRARTSSRSRITLELYGRR
ncbi:MAG: hypothetical protein V4466_17490 [Pseudomonadota bacterium]